METLLKDYPAVVTAISGIIGIVLGFFLGRWNSIESRDFARRAEIHDRKIRDARDYINIWADYADFMWFIQLGIVGEKDMHKIDRHMTYFQKRYPELPERVLELSKKDVGIDLLNDTELTNLKKELILTIRPLTENIERWGMLTIKEMLLAGKSFEIRNMTSKEFVNVHIEVHEIVRRMQARLDRLAQKVP